MELQEFLRSVAGPTWTYGYSSDPRPMQVEKVNGEWDRSPEPWATLEPGDKVYAKGADPAYLVVPAPFTLPYQGEALDPSQPLVGSVYWRAWKVKVTDWAKAQGLTLSQGAVIQRGRVRVKARLSYPEDSLESGDLLWVKTEEGWVSHLVEAPPEPKVERSGYSEPVFQGMGHGSARYYMGDD